MKMLSLDNEGIEMLSAQKENNSHQGTVHQRSTCKKRLQIKKGVIRGRTPQKDMQEKLEYTKGVIRAVHRIRTNKKSSKMQNGVIRGRTPNNDMHEEFEDTKGIIRRRIPKKDRQE